MPIAFCGGKHSWGRMLLPLLILTPPFSLACRVQSTNDLHDIAASLKRVSEMPRSGKEPYLTFGGINENNIAQLRLLNDVIFPVRYHDKFYADVLSLAPEFAKYAYWNGFVVGAVCCRLESYEGGKRRLYIMTLGVLAAYRGHGIGSKLLQSVLDAVAKHDGVVEVYLHVQTSNDDAINFYTKHHGFVKKEMVRNYYKRIEPPDCYILARPLGEGDVHVDPALAEA